MSQPVGLLAMAMGTPASVDEVESFYTRIRGRPPTPALVRDLRGRYAAIGGRSPLLDITRAQAEGVAARLAARAGTLVSAYVGTRYAPPFIADAVAAMRADGVRRVIGLALAPHPSALTTEAYAAQARRAIAEAGGGIAFEMAEDWHLHPGFLACLAARANAARRTFAPAERVLVPVLFTAHSLPVRVVEAGDPYPGAVRATADAVAHRLELARWHLAWQSASPTGEAWLGPDVATALGEIARLGVPGVIVCPVGFVADHLEVLYDIDVLYRRVAESLGLRLARTASLNDDPAFLDVLADAAGRRLGIATGAA